MSSACIIIPCYNESKRFPVDEYESFLANLTDETTLFFIDDGSTDDTHTVIQQLQAKFPTLVHSHQLTNNVGKAEAIRQGVKRCADLNTDYIGFFDADLATPLTEVNWLLEWGGKNNNPGFILGARVNLFGSTAISRYYLRHYFGRFFATIVSSMLKISIYDTQCGAKIFKTSLAEPLFSKPFISRWLFDIELIYRMIQHCGYKKMKEEVIEVPLRKWTEKGNSKISFLSLLLIPYDLFRIYIRYSFKRK